MIFFSDLFRKSYFKSFYSKVQMDSFRSKLENEIERICNRKKNESHRLAVLCIFRLRK